jgi:hypothetical protein
MKLEERRHTSPPAVTGRNRSTSKAAVAQTTLKEWRAAISMAARSR